MEGHISYKWFSQPQLRYGSFCGDFLLSSAILLSGNNYEKICLLHKYLQMKKSVHHNAFNNIQQQVICPVIGEYWSGIKEQNLLKLDGKDVILCGKCLQIK